MIPPRWIVTANADPDATRRLAAELRIPEALAAILVQRGLGSPDSAKAFLRPDLERLSDPHRFADMSVAVELLARAVREKRPILVHGDYDVDGQCAAAMLTRVLRSAGGTVHPFVPHRIRDGYDFGAAGLAEAYVALATIADVVPLIGENRILVRYGLKKLADSRWVGLRALIETAGLGGKPLRGAHVGFILAPRLNAVGRIGDANDGLRLLLTENPQEAAALARELETINARRQEMDQLILDEAIEIVEKTLQPTDAAIVLGAETWHPGVIGIVASRLVERYGRPTFLIGWDEVGEFGRGSGRSISGFDLHGALHQVGMHLEKYGGHTMAAGFTIRRDKFDAFRVAFLGVAGELLTPDDLAPSQRVDLELPLASVNEDLERLIRHLEPCGAGNPAPVFGVRNARAVGARRVGTNHLRFTLDDGSAVLPAIGFRWADAVPEDWLTNPLDVAFRLERDDWQGRVTIQARVASLAPHHRG